MTARSDEADRLWAALGDPMRIRLLDLLLERGEATASMLASALPITRQGVSKHLAILERDGFVTSQRTGREVRYAVRAGGLDQARAAMAQIAARWDTRLIAIKKMAEQAGKSSTPADRASAEDQATAPRPRRPRELRLAPLDPDRRNA